jgi:hypothetical protein
MDAVLLVIAMVVFGLTVVVTAVVALLVSAAPTRLAGSDTNEAQPATRPRTMMRSHRSSRSPAACSPSTGIVTMARPSGIHAAFGAKTTETESTSSGPAGDLCSMPR